MQAIDNILIVIDPEQPEMLALQRGRLIASPDRPDALKPKLHLLVCDDKDDHSPLLDQLRSCLSEDGFVVSTQQAWHKNLHQTITIAQQASGCDLVIKQHRADNPLKKALLTPEDWKLLRCCPAPLLMVKTDKPWKGGKILAAVDIGNAELQHDTLHGSILQHGSALAELTHGELHVLYAQPSPLVSTADPGFQPEQEIQTHHRKDQQDFQARYGITDERLHVVEGAADILIPQLAGDLHAVVTVIGTIARTGLSGALIGNTAEIVLDALESDVLVIKPEQVIEELEEMIAHF